MSRSGILKNTARFALAAVLCWLILRAVPFHEAAARLASASVGLLALSLAANLVAMYIQAIRWKVLLIGKGPSVWKLFLWNLVGSAASFVLPSSASGDVVKSLLMGKQEGVLGRSVMTTVLGRYLGIFATLFVCAAGILLWPAVRAVVSIGKLLAVTSFFALLAIGVFFVLSFVHKRRRHVTAEGKWSRRFDSALEIFHEALTHPKVVAQAFALTLLLQVTNLFAGWLLFVAIGDDIAFAPILALLPLVQLGTVAPLTMGGVGVREGLTLGLFHGLAKVARENCLAANLAGYVVTAALALIGLFAWIALHAAHRKSKGAQPPASA